MLVDWKRSCIPLGKVHETACQFAPRYKGKEGRKLRVSEFERNGKINVEKERPQSMNKACKVLRRRVKKKAPFMREGLHYIKGLGRIFELRVLSNLTHNYLLWRGKKDEQ